MEHLENISTARQNVLILYYGIYATPVIYLTHTLTSCIIKDINQLDDINRDIFQSNLLEQLENMNKILSCFLVIAIKDSTLKELTTEEIEKIMPVVNSVSNTISKNITNV